MDTTKPLRVVRSFFEFWLIGFLILVAYEHFSRHQTWGHQIFRSMLFATVPGLLGAVAELSRKNT